MRPRVFPAEDGDSEMAHTYTHPYASMRPRVFPAEDADDEFCFLLPHLLSLQ